METTQAGQGAAIEEPSKPEPRAEGPPPPEQPSPREVADRLQERLAEAQDRGYLRELRFEYEDPNNDTVGIRLKIRDARTDKLLRTIPPEDQAEFSEKLGRFLGLLLDEQV